MSVASPPGMGSTSIVSPSGMGGPRVASPPGVGSMSIASPLSMGSPRVASPCELSSVAPGRRGPRGKTPPKSHMGQIQAKPPTPTGKVTRCQLIC